MLRRDRKDYLEPDFGTAVSRPAAITPVTDSALPGLRCLLRGGSGNDPYALSPAYYAMTGRHGLWQVRRGGAAVLLCAHPNIGDCVLVFPPLGEGGDALLSRTLPALAASGTGVQLARFETPPTAARVRLIHEPERVLDWSFPVHTLDTGAVDRLAGQRFQNVRTHLRRLDMSRVSVRDIDPATDADAVMSVVTAWAGGEPETVDPYRRQMALFSHLPMAGRLVCFDGKPAGVSIFELTDRATGIANAYAHLALHEINGLSRYVIVDMCRTLRRRGFHRVCIGGSETEGLDRFKRKFAPAASVSLSSWRAEPLPGLGPHRVPEDGSPRPLNSVFGGYRPSGYGA